ncbi:MAG: RNA-binding protein, partial [Pseudomonadota bacterium]
MANKTLFASLRGRLVPEATARNAEGAPAYAYAPKHALAQLAMTGTLGQLFYASPEAELATAVRLAEEVEPEYLAKAAIHARAKGHMKDMPAVLLAVLARVDPVLFRR